MLAETLYDIGYTPSKADPDVWMRPAIKANGFKCYDLVLCYVDNVLAISHDPMKAIDGFRRSFTLKDNKAEEPETYLAASLEKMATDAGVDCWTMSSEKYCKAAVQNVESTLNAHGRRLPSKCRAPLKSGYRP